MTRASAQDFWAAAVATPDGTHSPAPVRTRFGYHVIRVEARK
jgi:parvulin-like peptidyl-prolyl isomerase